MLILLLYFPLFLKILLHFVVTHPQSALLKKLGHIEYFISPFRDTLLALILALSALYHFYTHNLAAAFYQLGLVLISAFNRFHRTRFRKQFCLFIEKADHISPTDFFETYYRGLGSFRNLIPQDFEEINFEKIDYRNSAEEPKHSIKPMLLAAIDTATLAKLAIFAMQNFEGDRGIDLFDCFARIWGARISERAQMCLKLETSQHVAFNPKLQGKILLVFNHKSYLDFALNFFALAALKKTNRLHLRPRFIAAKDHFIDNPLIYSWLGVGKCIQKAGMIFINRQKGKGWLAMQEAAAKLVEKDVEVAVYPQGTRAWGLQDKNGIRMDAGYYTTFSSKNLEDPKGHLKIGTAQMALDAALTLKQKGESLYLLFIGIDGSATVGPKGSFKIQTQAEVIYRLGNLKKIEIPDCPLENPQGKASNNEAQKNYLATLDAIQNLIDRELQQSIFRHNHLTERICKDCPDYSQALQLYLKRENDLENNIPFVILDRLYALPHAQWTQFQQKFISHIESHASTNDWIQLLREVSSKLVKKS